MELTENEIEFVKGFFEDVVIEKPSDAEDEALLDYRKGLTQKEIEEMKLFLDNINHLDDIEEEKLKHIIYWNTDMFCFPKDVYDAYELKDDFKFDDEWVSLWKKVTDYDENNYIYSNI